MKNNKGMFGTIVIAALGLSIGSSYAQVNDKKDTYRKDDATTQIRGPAHKASIIIGTDVKNAQNEKLGRVDDMIVDLPSGRITYLILSTGGVLGIGDSLLAVPARKFDVAVSERAANDRRDKVEHLVLDATKAQLEAAPKFSKREWPNMDAKWMADVDGYYGVSGRDREFVRERTETIKARPDSDLAKSVRTAIHGDSTLSKQGREIQVTAEDGGVVTLRGEVASQDEKREIEAKAKGVAGVRKVDNKLEVK